MADTEKTPEEHEDSIPFFPDHVRTEFRVTVGLMLVLLVVVVLGMASPVGLGEPADPMNTPAHVKPEWYFLGLYQLLKYVSKTLGVLIPIVGVGLLFLLPFLDRKADASPRTRRIRFFIVVVVLIVLIAMTLWGELS